MIWDFWVISGSRPFCLGQKKTSGAASLAVGVGTLSGDRETSHFKMYPLIYRRLFHNVSLQKTVVITQFGRYVRFASKPGAPPVSRKLK